MCEHLGLHEKQCTSFMERLYCTVHYSVCIGVLLIHSGLQAEGLFNSF